MEDKSNIDLTAAEMSSLWTQYINDSLSICTNKYFLEVAKDELVRSILEFSIKTSMENIHTLEILFKNEPFPIPYGFNEEDVNIHAPKLFSDTFVLSYLSHMSILGMAANATALGLVTRPDVIVFHKKVLNGAISLRDKTRDVMLEQGTYIKPPYISTPDKVDFVQKQNFLNGFFGNKRTVTAIEATHLYLNVQTNTIGKVLVTGFAQITKDEEVKKYLLRGKKIAQKHTEIFSNFLKKDDLPAPMSWDSAITDTTTPVFSDKLIMFHVTSMIAAGIGNYGAAMAASPRRDIGYKYATLIPEIALYAEDGANIMIKNGWMEEPPQADDRDMLIKNK